MASHVNDLTTGNSASEHDPEAVQKQVDAVEHNEPAPEHNPPAEPIERSAHAPELNTRTGVFDSQAPEVVPQTEPAELGEYKDATYVETEDKEAPKKTILGLKRRRACILIVIILVVIIGAVLGGVLGTQLNKGSTATNDLPSSTSSATATATASASSSPTPTPTALTVIEARFGTADVTSKARDSMPQGNNLVVDMSTSWADPDPWEGARKCLALLYSLGDDIRTFVACEGAGEGEGECNGEGAAEEDKKPFTLEPEDQGLCSDRITHRESPDPNFTIVSVVWGAGEIRDSQVYNKLYACQENGDEVPFNNEFFLNTDSLVGKGKSAVIWYTLDNYKTFRSLNGKENGNGSFEL